MDDPFWASITEAFGWSARISAAENLINLGFVNWLFILFRIRTRIWSIVWQSNCFFAMPIWTVWLDKQVVRCRASASLPMQAGVPKILEVPLPEKITVTKATVILGAYKWRITVVEVLMLNLWRWFENLTSNQSVWRLETAEWGPGHSCSLVGDMAVAVK